MPAYPNQSSVIRGLWRIHEAKLSLKNQSMRTRSRELWNACHRLFPSYKAALAAARIPLEVLTQRCEIQWSRRKIIKQFKQFAAKGIPLNMASIHKHDQRVLQAAIRHFDSYDDALRAAGFDPEQIKLFRQWTSQEVLDAIGKLRDEKVDLSYANLNKHHIKLCRAMCDHFGSHKKALQAAGIEGEQLKSFLWKIWSKQAVIAAIHKLRDENADLTRVNIRKHHRKLLNAMNWHFGGHKQALRAAGIDPDLYKTVVKPNVAPGPWKPDTLVAALKEMHSRGQDVRERRMREKDALMWRASKKLFGSYLTAVREAGIDYPTMSQTQRALHRQRTSEETQAAQLHWKPETLLSALKTMHANGEDLRHRTMWEKHRLMLWAAKKLFGSYEAAVREAGIDYWTMSQAHLALQRLRGNANAVENPLQISPSPLTEE
jgi:hypothetical protein